MRVSGLRIIGVTLVLALGGAATLYLQHAYPPSNAALPLTKLLPPAWIPLPETPSLLEDYETRQSIIELLALEALLEPSRNLPPGQAYDSRLARCGTIGASEEDRYRLWVLGSLWGSITRTDFQVRGSQVQVSRLELGVTAPADPLALWRTRQLDEETKYSDLGVVALDELDGVRALWLSRRLWDLAGNEPVETCHHGGPVILDACVNGKFALRLHQCGDASKADADALIAAVERVVERQRAPSASAPGTTNP